MDFAEALEQLGFRPEQDRPGREVRTYAAHPNAYMTYWVHAAPDGTALFTWEFAIADYLSGRGIQLGAGEVLNLFMFPQVDDRGPQDGAWLVGVVDGAAALLSSIDFANPQTDGSPAR